MLHDPARTINPASDITFLPACPERRDVPLSVVCDGDGNATTLGMLRLTFSTGESFLGEAFISPA